LVDVLGLGCLYGGCELCCYSGVYDVFLLLCNMFSVCVRVDLILVFIRVFVCLVMVLLWLMVGLVMRCSLYFLNSFLDGFGVMIFWIVVWLVGLSCMVIIVLVGSGCSVWCNVVCVVILMMVSLVLRMVWVRVSVVLRMMFLVLFMVGVVVESS